MNTKPSSKGSSVVRRRSEAGYITSWTEELFDWQRSLFRNKKLRGNYGVKTTLNLGNLMRSSMMDQITGGRALVIGSQGHLLNVKHPISPKTK